MDFTKFDIKILVVATFALLLISATAGATPIGGDFGEVPTYNQTANLDLEVPSTPGADVSTEGTLRAGTESGEMGEQRFVLTSDNLDVAVSVYGYNPPDTTSVTVALTYFNTTDPNNPQTTDVNETLNLSESVDLELQNTVVRFDYTNNTENYAEVDWDVLNQPNVDMGDNNSGLIGSINNIGEWIGYIAEILVFITDAIFAGISFTFTMITGIVGYIVSLIGWITGGYGTIIGSSPAWSSPFLAIPPLALGFELLKLLALMIDIIWIG